MTVHISFTSDAANVAREMQALRTGLGQITKAAGVSGPPLNATAAGLRHIAQNARIATPRTHAMAVGLREIARQSDPAARGLSRVNEQMRRAGGALRGALGGRGGLIGAGIGLHTGLRAIRAATEVEQARTHVTRIGGGDAADQLRVLDNLVKSLPHDYGTLAATVSNFNALLKVSGTELEKISGATAQFATVAGQDLGAVNQLIGQTFLAYKTRTADAAVEQLETVLGLVQQYRLNVPALLHSLGRVGATFRGLGFDFAQTATLVAQITQFGVNVEQLNEPLRQMAVNMAKLGLEPREGLEKAVEDIAAAKNEAEAFNIASRVFGTEGGHVFVDAIRNQQIPALLELGTTIDADLIPSLQAIHEETATVAERFKVLGNEIKAALSDKATPALHQFLDGLENSRHTISAFFSNVVPEFDLGFIKNVDRQQQALDEFMAEAAASAHLAAIMGEIAGRTTSAEQATELAKARTAAAQAELASLQAGERLNTNALFGYGGTQQHGGFTPTEAAQLLDAMRHPTGLTASERGAAGLVDTRLFGAGGQQHGAFTTGAAQRFLEEQRATRAAREAAAYEGVSSDLQNIIAAGPTTGLHLQLQLLREQQSALQGMTGLDAEQLALRARAERSTQEQIVELLEQINGTLEEQEMNIYLDGNLLDRVATGPIAGRARGTC